jgi:lysophospholipase L1-like esterase
MQELPGNAEEYDVTTVERLKASPLQGKKVLFLGSSVTLGYASEGQSLAEYVAARMGAEVVKEAVNGTTLADTGEDSYVQRLLRNVDPNQAFDLLVCQLSTNDATKGMPLGAIGDDARTVTGAMEFIADYARTTWGCPIVFYTGSRFQNGAYASMVARAKELASQGKIGLINLWDDDEFNDVALEPRKLYMADPIHPTRAGYRNWWGPEFERQLIAWFAP